MIVRESELLEDLLSGDRREVDVVVRAKPPHFHADYGEYGITVTTLDGVMEGQLPGRALRHVLE
jgi:Domain of unknown function (DUF4160)